MTSTAAAQAAPAHARRPEAASASAPSTSAAIQASLWPPPAKCSASSGFQPANAQAKTGRGERRTASPSAARTASAASTLKIHAAASADSPAARATGSEASVNAGP